MASLPTRMADKQATLDARPLYSHVVTSRVYHKKRKKKKERESPSREKFVLLDYKEVQSLLLQDHDLVPGKQVEMSISEEVMHRELTDSQAGKSLIPPRNKRFYLKKSIPAIKWLTMKNRLKVESPILSLVPNKRTTGASELQECNDMHEETTSDNSSGEVGTTLALLAGTSPKLSDRLREISNSLLKWFPNSETPAHIGTPKRVSFSSCTVEAKTTNASSCLGLGDSVIADMPQESLVTRTTDMKKSLQKVCLTYINSADKPDLKRLKGIGEVRANMILQFRDNDLEPFKDVRKFQIDLGFGIVITELKYHVPSKGIFWK